MGHHTTTNNLPKYPRANTLPNGTIQLRQLLSRRTVQEDGHVGVEDTIEKVDIPPSGIATRERYRETLWDDGTSTVDLRVPDVWNL